MPPKQKGQSGKGAGGAASTSSSSSITQPKAGPSWVAPKSITHPEHHHTLNHLNQTAAYYSVISTTALQSQIVRAAKTLSRKAVIRLDTSVKHASCPKCDSVWVEGLTVKTRSRGSGPHDHVVKRGCLACGGMVRRPAPNVVPHFQEEGQGKTPIAEEGKGKDKDRKENVEEVEMAKGKRKASQRQRRRTGAVKRRNLKPTADEAQSEPLTTSTAAAAEMMWTKTAEGVWRLVTKSPSSAQQPEPKVTVKLSRKERRQQRLERLSKRPSPSRIPPPAKRQRIRKPPTEPPILDDSSLPDPAPPPEQHKTAEETSAASLKGTKDQDSDSCTSRSGRAAQRPHLPHFNDRVQSSHWDDGLARLEELHKGPTQEVGDKERDSAEYAKQALEYYQKAARSRGDHVIVCGVGKNGVLGPVLP